MSDWHAYVAGFFDGEGSVCITRNRSNGLSDYHKIIVHIGQRSKYREILDRVCAEFGGRVGLRKQPTRVSRIWAEQADWQLQDKPGIERFLLAMQPYSIVKARQIEIGLEFIRVFRASPNIASPLGRFTGKLLSADEIEAREQIRLRMHDANELGPPRVKPSSLPALDIRHRTKISTTDDKPPERGTQRYNAKLTDDRVRSIRSDYATGEYTQAMLAEREGVSLMLINGIVRRTRWGHVEDAPPTP